MNKLTLTGYVLHKRAYRETSVIVDFFTLEHGKLSVVARGVRTNTKSDKKSLLQILQKLEFEAIGRSNLKNLGRIEALGQAIPLSKKSLYCAFYLNEILSRSLQENEPCEEIFVQYEQSLHALMSLNSDASRDFEPILREFEFSLICGLGYAPDFESEAYTGDCLYANQYYVYQRGLGFICAGENDAKAMLGQNIIYLSTTVNLRQQNNRNVLKVAKIICREALRDLIGEKPIKSRDLFIE